MSRKKVAPGLGYVPLARAVLRRDDIIPTDKVILMAIIDLAYFAGPRDGVCRATNEELGLAIGGLKKRAVVDSLDRLVTAGLIMRIMAGPTTRDGLKVAFDRFGGADMETQGERGLDLPAPCSPVHTPLAVQCIPPLQSSAYTPCSPVHTPLAVQCIPPPIESIESIEKTPSTPLVLMVTESASLSEIASPLSAAPDYIPGDPVTTVAQLQAWVGTQTDDAKLIRSAANWVTLVQSRLPAFSDSAIEWVQDAVIKGIDQGDDDKGGPTAYALGCLNRWIAQGGRPHVEILQAVAREAEAKRRPDAEKLAREKVEAEASREAQKAQEALDEARWTRLPVRDRDAIERQVLDENTHLRSMRNAGKLVHALCITMMKTR